MRENFRGGMVLQWPIPPTSHGIEVQVHERITDPDPIDTTIGSVFTYTVIESGRRPVETDVHHTGLFPPPWRWRRIR